MSIRLCVRSLPCSRRAVASLAGCANDNHLGRGVRAASTLPMQLARTHAPALDNEIAIDLQIENADGKIVRLQGHIEFGGPRLGCDLSVTSEDIWATARLDDEDAGAAANADAAENIESALLRLAAEPRPRRVTAR